MKTKLEDMPKHNLITIVRNIQKELKNKKRLFKMELTKDKDGYHNLFYWGDVSHVKGDK